MVSILVTLAVVKVAHVGLKVFPFVADHFTQKLKPLRKQGQPQYVTHANFENGKQFENYSYYYPNYFLNHSLQQRQGRFDDDIPIMESAQDPRGAKD